MIDNALAIKREVIKGKKLKSAGVDDFDLAVMSHYIASRETVYGEAVNLVSKYEHWSESGTVESICHNIRQAMFKHAEVPFHGPAIGKEKFTFIDLFAGIGGFRLALQSLGGRCIFSSEWDKYSKQTYFANYGEMPFGDITDEHTKAHIPAKFDILCAGFPCQPFSIAGVSKKNSLGRQHGFADEKQGNLFFHIEEILAAHRPKVFFLENVKNLVNHDKGRTFEIIKNTLEELRYSFNYRVLDGKHFVPQHRERTIMVGFDKDYFGNDIAFDFDQVEKPGVECRIADILENPVDSKYTLSDKLWNYLQDYSKKHKAKGNGFGFGLCNLEGVSRTLSARYYKDGSEILIPQIGKNPRRLTPNECAGLQGYPVDHVNHSSDLKSFLIPVSDNQAYRQFGNSVVVPLIREVGKYVVQTLCSHDKLT